MKEPFVTPEIVVVYLKEDVIAASDTPYIP